MLTHPFVFMLLLLATSIVGNLYVLSIALRSPVAMVEADPYGSGMRYEETLVALRKTKKAGLTLHLDEGDGRPFFRVEKERLQEEIICEGVLKVELTRADDQLHDKVLTLQSNEQLQFSLHGVSLKAGRWSYRAELPCLENGNYLFRGSFDIS